MFKGDRQAVAALERMAGAALGDLLGALRAMPRGRAPAVLAAIDIELRAAGVPPSQPITRRQPGGSTMRRFAVVALIAAPLCALSGCAAFDWLFGRSGTGEPGTSPLEVFGSFLNILIPGATAVAGAATTAYAALRGKQWKKAAVATFDVIESGAKAGKSVAALKGELKVAHSAAGVQGVVKAVVDKYGHSGG